MNVPSINGPRGLFHVFFPGVFFVLNLALLLVRTIPTGKAYEENTLQLFSSGTLVAAVIITVGYLSGAVFRLLRAGRADRCSIRILVYLLKGDEREEYDKSPSKIEENKKDNTRDWDDRTQDPKIHGYLQSFPYENWLCTNVAENLGPKVQEYVRIHWSRKWVPQIDLCFVNHWKTIIALKHPELHAVLDAEEGLVRFVANMFYALCASSVLLVVSWGIAIYECAPYLATEPVLLFSYLTAIVVILLNFRKLRAKEAELFLSSCYAAQTAEDAKPSPIVETDRDK